LSEPYTSAAGRKFGLTVGAAFGVLAAIGWWRGHSITPMVLGTVATLLVVAGLVLPSSLGVVERTWMRLAHALSRFTTPIFMGVVYFVVVTPVGFVRRALGGNALVHRVGPHGLWFDRTTSPPSALDRLF